MRTMLMTSLASLALAGPAVAQVTQNAMTPPQSRADQMASAVLAAPEEMRADATILGWEDATTTVTLREGTGQLICLADRPGDAAFSVACYHKDLATYMARGRELEAEGITGGDRNEQHRWQEARDGKLAMPTEPRMLYVVSGSGFDAASGEITDRYERWVLYWPNATAESVGLSATPVGPGVPWLMNEGTPGAHIMISPPRQRN